MYNNKVYSRDFSTGDGALDSHEQLLIPYPQSTVSLGLLNETEL